MKISIRDISAMTGFSPATVSNALTHKKSCCIPEDISMIGFDDLPFSEISSPRLTTLKVPNIEMGKLAVRRIVDMIDGRDDIVVKTQVCTKFVIRDTVKDRNGTRK